MAPRQRRGSIARLGFDVGIFEAAARQTRPDAADDVRADRSGRTRPTMRPRRPTPEPARRIPDPNADRAAKPRPTEADAPPTRRRSRPPRRSRRSGASGSSATACPGGFTLLDLDRRAAGRVRPLPDDPLVEDVDPGGLPAGGTRRRARRAVRDRALDGSRRSTPVWSRARRTATGRWRSPRTTSPTRPARSGP